MKLIVCIPIIMLFASCATQFFLIERSLPIVEIGGRLSETYVISNPPRNKAKLAALIEMHNKQTISYEQLMNNSVRREYYRETISLTRNFEQGKPYTDILGFWLYDGELGQQIGNHADASLGRSYFSMHSGEFIYHVTLKGQKLVLITTDNPKEFLLKE